MTMMMFILGSGMMEHPILLRFVTFLSAAVFLGLLAWEASRRSEKKMMRLASWLLAVAAMICLSVSVCHAARLLPEEQPSPCVEKIEYENHAFLVFREKCSIAVVHHPDCGCRKMFRVCKEK